METGNRERGLSNVVQICYNLKNNCLENMFPHVLSEIKSVLFIGTKKKTYVVLGCNMGINQVNYRQ